MAVEILNFDAKTVPLKGTNLIEASAGTGKTYSIAILVLRILLEIDIKEDGKNRNISIKEILMVTFTKAAVAELETRVRSFIRMAYGATQGENCEDETITAIIEAEIARRALKHKDDLVDQPEDGESIEEDEQLALANNKAKKEVEARLFEALTFLDEASVQTIHSFCQQVLREFAFETRQSFSVDLVTDMSQVITTQLNQFWRSNIAVMPLDFLQLLAGRLNRADLSKVIGDYFSGKPIYNYDPNQSYPLDEAFFDGCRSSTQTLQQDIASLNQQMLDMCADRQTLEMWVSREKNAIKTFGPLIDQPTAFLETFWTKFEKPPQYLERAFPELLEIANKLAPLSDALNEAQTQLMHHIYAAATSIIGPSVSAYKEKHGQLCFDDLIEQLYQRLCLEDNPALINAIRKKFKVVFIDEFQDTDRKQYEIFNTAFGKDTVVFYIGDPKQSIYAWRKADIDTYLKAGEHVDRKYGMHVNYRSTNDFIAAMNGFFMPTADFDTFYYKDNPQGIHYHLVTAPAGNKKGRLLCDKDTFPVITITEQPNMAEVENALVAQVAAILSGKYSIETIVKNAAGEEVYESRPVRPSDLGILVRRNRDMIPLKKALSRYGIPSVVIGNAKILETEEAKEVLYVLDAILEQSRNAINKALLTSITGMSIQDVLNQDDVITTRRFGAYKLAWEKNGVYKALFSFIADYKVENYLTDPRTRNGERIISNLYQLIELLYKQQSNKKLSPVELKDWLSRSIEDPIAEGDEYEQRVESDDQSVTIMTVHKSKGLQFNIVLTHAMDLMTQNGHENFFVFKNKAGVDEVIPADLLIGEDLEQYDTQRMQENRRMLYVILTRGVYACFIYSSTYSNKKQHCAFYAFLNAFKENLPEGIRFMEPLIVPEGFRYKRKEKDIQITSTPKKDTVSFVLLENNWRKLSYTYLAAAPSVHSPYESRNPGSTYDQFVFQVLRRGNITGNLLHDVFEHISFEQSGAWSKEIQKAVSRYAPHDSALYEPMLLELLEHTSFATIKTDNGQFSLSQTSMDKRLNEFEFDFPVHLFNRSDLSTLIGDKAVLQTNHSLGWEGMMNGKIDMLFEHSGKYYVLDWKSTYLGGELSDYAARNLEQEMSRHNYHLQYLIYTVATAKYLIERLEDFDYERDFGGVLYYFVRGVRAGSGSGIYFVKPPEKIIASLIALWSTKTSEITDY